MSASATTPRPLELSFRLDEVPPEGRAFVGALPEAKLVEDLTGLVGTLGYRSEGPAEVTGTVYRSARSEVIVDGTVKARVGFDCVRCLEARTLDVSIRQDHVLVKRKAPARTDDGLTVDEADLEEPDVESYAGDQIELADLFRQDLLLALPMNPSCDDVSEGETACTDLAETPAAAEAQIDPRWAPLLELKKKMT